MTSNFNNFSSIYFGCYATRHYFYTLKSNAFDIIDTFTSSFVILQCCRCCVLFSE